MKPIESNQAKWGAVIFDWLLLLCVFFVVGGTPPPDVNEAHYLGKAKHYWDASYCANDHFMQSADAHTVFYWTFGWLTRFMSLPAAAWCGRLITWSAIAAGWLFLSRCLWPRPLVAVISGAIMVMLTRETHMAGEWLIGGVEAKGLSFAAIFVACGLIIRGRWPNAMIAMGAATLFHVLVGGWAAMSLGCAALLEVAHWSRRRLVLFLLATVGASGLAAVSLYPALALAGAAETADKIEAYRIYVYERLPHHLVATHFPDWFVARHLMGWALFAALWWLARDNREVRRLNRMVWFTAVLAAVGCVLTWIGQVDTAWVAGWLRYYWFRASDMFLPLGITWTGMAVLKKGFDQERNWASWAVAVTIVLPMAWLANTYYLHQQDRRPLGIAQSQPRLGREQSEMIDRWHQWQEMCDWVRDSTAADAIFLTPPHQQTFKWYAERGEVATWKDVPQDASTLLEWWERFSEVYSPRVQRFGLSVLPRAQLAELAHKYHADYVILDRHMDKRLAWQRVYPPSGVDSQFEIYRVPPK